MVHDLRWHETCYWIDTKVFTHDYVETDEYRGCPAQPRRGWIVSRGATLTPPGYPVMKMVWLMYHQYGAVVGPGVEVMGVQPTGS
jgi:hypothetical protein